MVALVGWAVLTTSSKVPKTSSDRRQGRDSQCQRDSRLLVKNERKACIVIRCDRQLASAVPANLQPHHRDLGLSTQG